MFEIRFLASSLNSDPDGSFFVLLLIIIDSLMFVPGLFYCDNHITLCDSDVALCDNNNTLHDSHVIFFVVGV